MATAGAEPALGGCAELAERIGTLAVGAELARPLAEVAPAAVGPAATGAGAVGTTGGGGVVGRVDGAGGGGGGELRRPPPGDVDSGLLPVEGLFDRRVSEGRGRAYALAGGREADPRAALVSAPVLLVVASASDAVAGLWPDER